jgi:hypothetical protein
MSRERKEGYELSCELGIAAAGAGCRAIKTEAVRTDGLWTQQEQQDGGQQSWWAPQRQSEHEPATAAKGSRNAKAASSTARR